MMHSGSRSTSTHSTRTSGRKQSATRRLSDKRRLKSRKNLAGGARFRLRNFRKATLLAVAFTALILLLFNKGDVNGQAQDEDLPDTVAVIREIPLQDILRDQEEIPEKEPGSKEATEEALSMLRGIWKGIYNNLPKVGLAILALLIAWLIVSILRPLMRKILGRWQRSEAIIAITGIVIWLFAAGIALSVLAGDLRALVGSVGLIGLALSWALQTPIESFTGWLLNSFRGYYRHGDRIIVGDVFGDVYRIDLLTTTLWEIGSPERPGFVNAEQPTGRLVTFPNNEVLAGTIINLTRDFPYVWDEVAIQVANESDIRFAMNKIEELASSLLGSYMKQPAKIYEEILQRARLETSVADAPQVFLSQADSWTNIVVRYLVSARERRKWKTELILLISETLNKEEFSEKIIPVYPRRQLQIMDFTGNFQNPQI